MGEWRRREGGSRPWKGWVVLLVVLHMIFLPSSVAMAVEPVHGPRPEISDTSPKVNQVLEAEPGDWGSLPTTLKYQWARVSPSGETTRILGENSVRYRVTSDDLGHRLVVTVSASKGVYRFLAKTSAATAEVVEGEFDVKAQPEVVGKAHVGKTVTAYVGEWEPVPSYFSLQWYRSGEKIPRANARHYTIEPSDVGKTLAVEVTAVREGLNDATVMSEEVEATEVPSDLRVATFNLSGQHNDRKAKGEQRVWAQRLPAVASQIVRESPDVIGLQEAYQRTLQYDSLRNAVNQAGYSYQVVDRAKSASNGTRIMYNSDTVTLLDKGAFAYSNQARGKTTRYMVWATFRHNESGKEFFFANTHLSPDSTSVKVREWRELISKVKSLNTRDLPVIVVGDFNTSKFSPETKSLLPAMKNAGFGDVMNQQYKVNPPVNPRAEEVVNGWVNSFNDFRRDMSAYSYRGARHKVGNGIDWIFATNSLRVKQWKVVIDFDPDTKRVKGVIPSDHNMITAIVVL